MTRTPTYNFSAGPAMLPDSVKQQIKDELLDWHDGMSVMEVGHRTPLFIQNIVDRTESTARELLNISEDYHVIFVPGGARGQFSMVPMNLSSEQSTVDYFNTGFWSKIAIEEAKQFATVNVVAQTNDRIPAARECKYSAQADYVHYTSNETISGVAFPEPPKVTHAPLVGDMSSDIMSRPIDVNQFGLIYACAQKNIGIAGVTLVIIRKDLVKPPIRPMPSIFSYANQCEHRGMYNTPVTFSWYVTHLMLEWIKNEGGLDLIAKRNHEKSKKLYDFIDKSSFYENRIDVSSRSCMNVTFFLPNTDLEAKFLEAATAHHLHFLKGHRYAGGGMRASIYNAMPMSGVDALISFMSEFERSAT